MRLEPIPTRFYTFYSFKGGVGRSMALYNCACVLAGSGRRVLVIDFDLEAPGLTFLPDLRPQSQKPAARARRGKRPAASPVLGKPGLIDIILEFVRDPKAWLVKTTGSPEAVNEYITDLEIPDAVKVKDYEGRLGFIAAGRLGPDFASNLQKIRWDTAPLAESRNQLFALLRDRIVGTGQFDYVLVDARTGLSEEGYISTRILADHIVALTGLNDQNIRGTALFLRDVDAWNREDPDRQRRVILVESPIPETEEEAKKRRHERVQKMFKEELGHELDFTLALPYHPLLALHEEVMVANWPGSGVAKAYFRLTELLRTLAEDDADTWSRRAMEAIEQPSGLRSDMRRSADVGKAQAALEVFRSIDAENFPVVARSVAGLAAGLEPPDPKAIGLLRRLTETEPNEPQFYRDLATVLQCVPEGQDPCEARVALQRVVDIERKRGDGPSLSNALYWLANLDRLLGQYDKSRKGFTEALRIDRELGDQRGIALALQSLAHLDNFRGRYTEARTRYEEALQRKLVLGDRREIAITWHSLAILDRLQGQYVKARTGFEKALKVANEIGDRQGIVVMLHSLASLDCSQGRNDEAKRGYEEALKIARELGDRRLCLLSEFWLRATDALASPHEGIAPTLEALGKLESQADPFPAAWAYLRVAEVYRAAEDYPSALESIGKTLSLCEKDSFEGVAAEARALRATILDEQGNQGEAVEDARRAIDFFDREDVCHPLRDRLDAIVASSDKP